MTAHALLAIGLLGIFASGAVAGYAWSRPKAPVRVTVPCLVDGVAGETWGPPGFAMTVNGRKVVCP